MLRPKLFDKSLDLGITFLAKYFSFLIIVIFIRLNIILCKCPTYPTLLQYRPEERKRPGEGGIEEKHAKPIFRQVPQDLEVREDNTVRFDCTVGGRPSPELQWFRDDQPVLRDDNHQV